MRRTEGRIGLGQALEDAFGLGIAAERQQQHRAVGGDGLRRRLDPQRRIQLRQGLAIAPARVQIGAVPVMDGGAAGFQAERAAKLAVGVFRFPEAVEQGEGQGGVGIARTVVQRDRRLRRRPRQRKGLGGRHGGIFRHQVIDVGQADIGVGIVRIEPDGLVEIVDGGVQAGRRARAPGFLAAIVQRPGGRWRHMREQGRSQREAQRAQRHHGHAAGDP